MEDNIEIIDITEIDLQNRNIDIRNPSIARHYTNVAYIDHVTQKSRTKLIVVDGVVVGFYTLEFISISLSIIDEYDDGEYLCIALKFIAVDFNHRGNGIGSLVLNYIITIAEDFANQVGCRCFYLEALTDKVSWYLSNGFRFLDIEDELRYNNNRLINATVKMFIDYRDYNEYNILVEGS